MWSHTGRVVLFLALQLFFLRAFSIQIWNNPGALPTTIPAGCRAALSQNLTCSPDLVSARFVAGGRSLDKPTLTAYCTTDCFDSLQTFKTNVDTRCGDTLYQMFANSELQQSGASVADPLAWAYSVTCIQDETGFCLSDLYKGTKTACSDCSLKYGAAMLSSDYGRAKIQPNAFSSLLSSCGTPASKYPYTYTSTSSVSSTTAASSVPTASCAGTPYTVSSQDTCQSISQANSIAVDLLISSNNLDYNCSSLKPGTKLCLGPKCALQTVTQGQTCQSITANKRFTLVQLTSWNPTIHANCDNLDAMVGRNICVSPPGSLTYDASTLDVPATAAMSSMFPGPFVTGAIVASPPKITTSWYNPQTTFLPPPTTTITANLTAASLIAARTGYCPISPDDYGRGVSEADLPAACQALVEPYCYPNPDAPIPTSTRFLANCTPVQPLATSTTANLNAVPSPLEPNTVASCKQYYQVIGGDNCYGIANSFGISLDQFNAWNPYVGADCAKLFLGYYVCIKA